VRNRDGYTFEDTLTVYGLDDMPADPTQAGRNVNRVLEKFAHYFMSAEGQLQWQLQKI
jgi:hypothetical protein